MRRLLGIGPGCRMVLAIGRLHPQKGFDVLIAAAASMAAARPAEEAPAPKRGEPVFAIAVEGPASAELEAQLRGVRRCCDVDVRFLGDRSEDLADLVGAADVVVMPSRWEGWPLAAAEVLGAGRPLIATAVGGLPELVGDAAVLVPAGDAEALAAAVSELLADPLRADALSARARARAAELPTDAEVVRSLLETYGAIVRGPGPAGAHR